MYTKIFAALSVLKLSRTNFSKITKPVIKIVSRTAFLFYASTVIAIDFILSI
jgi:hypothetical protein